ncbi:MAG TPA: hypothetical protein VHX11_10295 [Acidobacteriaceae bacterium]|jgi:multidrug efflux pump subunit AcrA (membrane-fusion protein)|nr:hypothetical protein [Acidobacteriaceae bacterium]
MSDGIEQVERTHSGVFIGIVCFAALASLAGLVWSYSLQTRLSKTESQLIAAQQQNDQLAAQLKDTDARLRITSESAGLTQRQLDARAKDLLKKEQADDARLEQEQQNAQASSQKQIGAVSGEVSNVKTDVGGVKTDVAQTKTELANTETKLQTAIGDLGVQSGLIATNAQQLDVLKHKGDRNYYEFTLAKGKKPTPLSGVSLDLKKSDPKHSRYTLAVYADDKTIEKKDRGLNEPVQFYTGKDNFLYEVVVNHIDKNQVSGYLSTPKGAPEPLKP